MTHHHIYMNETILRTHAFDSIFHYMFEMRKMLPIRAIHCIILMWYFYHRNSKRWNLCYSLIDVIIWISIRRGTLLSYMEATETDSMGLSKDERFSFDLYFSLEIFKKNFYPSALFLFLLSFEWLFGFKMKWSKFEGDLHTASI